ncbi:uncharacterized protein V6R79_010825 [Siganus canaliculatus]
MMKSIILLTVILLVSCLTVQATQNSGAPSQCCFRLYPKRLNKDNVMGIKFTDDRCAVRAVILSVRKGDYCVDPSQPWVKNIIQKWGLSKISPVIKESE